MYVYTEGQVQGQNLNTNKQLEVITNNELHCMSGNLFNVVLKHLQLGRYTDNALNKNYIWAKIKMLKVRFFKDNTYIMEHAMLNT